MSKQQYANRKKEILWKQGHQRLCTWTVMVNETPGQPTRDSPCRRRTLINGVLGCADWTEYSLFAYVYRFFFVQTHTYLYFPRKCLTHSIGNLYEPPHDKTNKVAVRPSKTQISLGIRPVCLESSLCVQWVAKDSSFLHADSEHSDQTGRMPRLIWVFAGRSYSVGFVMKRLICLFKNKLFGAIPVQWWWLLNDE